MNDCLEDLGDLFAIDVEVPEFRGFGNRAVSATLRQHKPFGCTDEEVNELESFRPVGFSKELYEHFPAARANNVPSKIMVAAQLTVYVSLPCSEDSELTITLPAPTKIVRIAWMSSMVIGLSWLGEVSGNDGPGQRISPSYPASQAAVSRHPGLPLGDGGRRAWVDCGTVIVDTLVISL